MNILRCTWMWLFLSVFSAITAQTAADSIYVVEVRILGHKKTRPGVVFREMPFGRGDTLALAELPLLVQEAYSNLMNTQLFSRVEVNYADWQPGNRVTFEVDVRENWYIYPLPIFELADRNFNVWWREQGRSLDRVNFGVRFTHYNFSGHRDRLRTVFQYGYTRNYQLGYRLPYLGRQRNVGLETNFSYQRRREQNYATLNNQQQFYLDRDRFVYRRLEASSSLSYRRRLYTQHTTTLGFRHEEVADTIAQTLNPDFFGGGRSRQDYFWFKYSLEHDQRDVRGYPWAGDYLVLSLEKSGLGLLGQRNGLELRATYRRYLPLGDHYSLSGGVTVKYSLLRNRQPFLENRAIGFDGNNLTGYQFYVVDGLDMIILQTSLRRELIDFRIRLPKLMFIDAFRRIPIRLLAAVHFDQGMTNSPHYGDTNALSNSWLTGLGVGLDLVLLYDRAVSFRYQRNHLGEAGFIMEFDTNF